MKTLQAGDIETLKFIANTYGPLIETAAGLYTHRPEVLAGIMCRESKGGLSKQLDRPGPEGRGDRGFGHGLCQIDSRSFPQFTSGEDWKDPEKNIRFAARVLAGKRAYIKGKLQGLTARETERLTVIAYNTGEGRVVRIVRAGKDPESATAHGDYGASVLAYAEAYLGLSG